MAQGRPYQAYQNTGVQTSNQKQLIVMLFDGMNQFMDRAMIAINEGELETAHHNLTKTGKILLELLSTLREDQGGEIASNLKRLYIYSYEQITLANLKKDVALIRQVQILMNNLRSAWKAIKDNKNTGNLPKGLKATG
jgi:flagellar protein FliS